MPSPNPSLRWPWWVSPVILLGLAASEQWGAGFSRNWSAGPFLISLFVLGMPHGAADLERFARAIGAPGLMRALPRFLPYLAIVLLTVLGIFLAPRAALLLFALLSAWHFGREDRHGTRLRTVRGMSRGLFLISAPIALHPSEVFRLASDWLHLLSQPELERSSWAVISSIAGLVASLSAITAGALIAALLVGREGRTALREIVEFAALGIAFAVLDPVFAVGAYFLFWHSLRQMESGPRPALATLTGLRVGALPLLLPTLVLYLGISGWVIAAWNPALQVALLLIFFAAVTPAHECLALWLEAARAKPAGAPADARARRLPSANFAHRPLVTCAPGMFGK